jgi:integrase
MAKPLTAKAIETIKPGPARYELPDGYIRGLYLCVQPSGKMSWAVRYRYKGTPRKLTLGSYPAIALKDARDLASKALVAVAGGADPATEKQVAKIPSETSDRDLVENVVAKFIERYAKAKQKAATAYETQRVLEREIVKPWKGRRLGDIKKVDVIEVMDAIADRGSPILANRLLTTLKTMFGWAIERGLLDASPCTGIKPPADEQARDRVLSDDEIAAVWKAAKGLGWPFGPAIKIMLLTGQRRGEVAGMRWAEIDFDSRTWTLPRERSKNAQVHTVPLSEQVIAILKSLPRVDHDGFVFTANRKTPIAGFAVIKKRMDAALPADMPGWVIHDLRRTFASGCARLGIAVHVVEAALNHRSGTIKGVAAVYNRYSYDIEKRGAMDAWARYVDQLLTGGPAANIVELAAARG